jgi:hypothetical protein
MLRRPVFRARSASWVRKMANCQLGHVDMQRFWRGLVIFLFGGLFGTAFGVALGFFFFPYVFPPPPAANS